MAQMKRTPRNRRAASAPPETALKPGGKPSVAAPSQTSRSSDGARDFHAVSRRQSASQRRSRVHQPVHASDRRRIVGTDDDAGVNKATRELFPIADTPQKILALGETYLRERSKSLGFFNTKAKNVIALCDQLIAKYDGRVPTRREELEALSGVGRKTANVVLNVAFARPTIAVDTHVFRVSNRIPLAIGATPLEVELGLEKVIPDEFKTHTHHWLILHGRYTCKARRPECERCIIPDLCRSPEKRV